MIDLYRSQGWQRLWVPEYFCYDVIASLKEAGLELRYYADWPGKDDGENDNLDLRQGDAILRVNYFGMRSYRSVEKLPVPVVEDHTHDLIGGWAMNSHADWCIASLRKTLPIPEGGMLWSPVGLRLPEMPERSEENERIAVTRWEAMRLKARYLAGEDVEKAAFRAGFVDTEEYFDRAEVCALDRDVFVTLGLAVFWVFGAKDDFLYDSYCEERLVVGVFGFAEVDAFGFTCLGMFSSRCVFSLFFFGFCAFCWVCLAFKPLR